MPSITVENDKLEVPVGRTVKGRDLVIVTTPLGHYRIEARGPGGPSFLSDQVFTSLTLAKRAVDNYRRANAAAIAKEELKNRVATGPSIKEQRKAERLAAAMELKNGELSVPETEE